MTSWVAAGSDQPDDPSLWRIARFVREVDTLRDALGLDRVHILGQSWGGWLAIEYMMTAPNSPLIKWLFPALTPR